MFLKNILPVISFSVLLLTLQACGGEQTPNQANSNQESGLSEFEIEHGIGPVTERMEIGEIDQNLVARGEDIFSMKCEMCHNMEGRMVGPELGNVLENRSIEYVMNMILNPSGMVNDHPEAKKLLQEYMTAMPYQNVSQDDARAIVEFLRDYNGE